jgi:hypothetical protein
MADERNRLYRGIKRVSQRPGALVALVGGASGGLLALALALAQKDPVSRCPGPHNAIGPPLDLVFVGLCAASFLAGGLVSDFDQDDAAEDAPQSERDRTWLQAIVVAVLAILFGLLAYETYSLILLDANPDSSLWPITWFVRCLSNITTVATIGSLVVVCIVCAFLGKWLWYRPRTLTSGRPKT